MRLRCNDPNGIDYPDYGGRGIRVHPEWETSFVAFLAHVGPKPSPDHSIDRYPNNDGHYEPGNVRWATWREQTRNKRNNRMLTAGTETLCISDWAERIGASDSTSILARLERGWSMERAVTTPIQIQRRRAQAPPTTPFSAPSGPMSSADSWLW